MSLSNDHILSHIANTTLYTLTNVDRFLLGRHRKKLKRVFPAHSINIYSQRAEPVHHTPGPFLVREERTPQVSKSL